MLFFVYSNDLMNYDLWHWINMPSEPWRPADDAAATRRPYRHGPRPAQAC